MNECPQQDRHRILITMKYQLKSQKTHHMINTVDHIKFPINMHRYMMSKIKMPLFRLKTRRLLVLYLQRMNLMLTKKLKKYLTGLLKKYLTGLLKKYLTELLKKYLTELLKKYLTELLKKYLTELLKNP